MTRDEHHARAMLLGMAYIPRYGYYYVHEPTYFDQVQRCDAVTLEPMTAFDASRRVDQLFEKLTPQDVSWYNEDGIHDEG